MPVLGEPLLVEPVLVKHRREGVEAPVQDWGRGLVIVHSASMPGLR